MVARRERFVTTKQFLDTARSYDITVEECILEDPGGLIVAGIVNY